MTFVVNSEDRFWKDSPQKEPPRSIGLLRYLLGVVVFVGLGIGGWKLYSLMRRPSLEGAELPLIRADETPHKVKAADQEVPGIHHQDKLVYGRIGEPQGGEVAPVVEHILPEPESPAVIQMTEQYTPQEMDLETPVAKSAESPQTPPPPTAPAIESIEDLIGAEAPSVPADTSSSSAPKGNVFIQLGSLKSQELAEAEWARALKKTDILGKLTPVIQRVDLGEDQGIYYRLRTGPFETVEDAQKACSTLKEEKVDCFVVKTGKAE